MNRPRKDSWRAVVVGALSLAAIATACRETPRTENTVVFKHGKVPGEAGHLLKLLDRFQTETGIRVVSETLPSSSDLQHQYFITALEGGGADLDVLSMDVIWVPEFSRAGWLADLTERFSARLRSNLFSAPLEASTYRGRIYGVPWYVDAGVLYYRKDLLDKYGLEVPQTYPELAEAARRVLEGEARGELHGFLFQGKQYEGLVCVALEVLSSFGGEVLREDRVVLDEPEAEQAFRFMRKLLTSGVSPPMVTSADEEATRRVFGDGRAVFLRNWVYAWNLFEHQDSPVRGRVGLASIPPGPGGTGGATLGGWQLGISRASRRPEQAWALVEFLSRPDSQAYLNRTVGYRPALRSLYVAPAPEEERPLLPRLLPIIETARPRPVTPLYLALSQTLQAEISAILAGIKDAREALEDAQREIEFILEETPS